jgi:competence protein ComEC
MSDVQVYIWNVEHGDAILVKGPDENAVIDLGKHSNGFSPTEQMKSHGVENIGFLMISHPDEDHIKDITTFFDEFSPNTLSRPKAATSYIEHRAENVYPDKDEYQKIANKYLDIDDHYSGEVGVSPTSSDRNQGLTFKSYKLSPTNIGLSPAGELSNDDGGNINSLSFLTVMKYGAFKLTTMGDLESDAIEQLLEKTHIQDRIKGTDVLIAPHHGRNSSYTADLFDVISPDIVAISDAGGTENSAADKYSDQATGKSVERRNGDNKRKNRITTYSDGVLYLGVDEDGSYSVIID